MVFDAKYVVGCARDPAVGLTFTREGLGGVRSAGAGRESGNVVDANREEGTEAGRKGREGEEGV